jgi:hypothetical protein
MSVAVATIQGIDRRALRTGLLAALLLAVGYSLIIGVSSRSVSHLLSQWRVDALFIALVTAGFGVQMGLFSRVRRVIRGDGRAEAVAAGSTATSTTAMVACCLHHLNDIVPFLGLSGAATFLLAYKTPVILLSLAANGVGILLMLRTLRHARRAPAASTEAPACH